MNGRFVVFVYADGSDGCAMADRWKQANAGIGAYSCSRSSPATALAPASRQGWHQYAPAVAADRQTGYSYSISPGF